MDNIYRVKDLIQELEEMPPESPVLVTVVKYPQDSMNRTEWGDDWDEGDDVEVVSIDQTYVKQGIVHLCAELTDYSEERREYLDSI